MSEFLAQENIVPRPYQSDHRNISPWLDEQIWGHRIWDSQTPWLLFLEFLTVAEGCLRENKLFDEKGEIDFNINIFINDKPMTAEDDMSTRLSEGDVILIFMPVAGG